MAQISSYSTLTPQLGDKVLGSNTVDSSGTPVLGNPTCQFSLTSIKTLVDQDYVSQLESSSASAAQASALNTVYSVRFGTPSGAAGDNVQLLQGTGGVTDGNKILFNAAGNPAIIINIEFLKTCPYKTLFSVKPFALAVITYCWLIWSKKEFFVKNVSPAKLPISIAIKGKQRCQK